MSMYARKKNLNLQVEEKKSFCFFVSSFKMPYFCRTKLAFVVKKIKKKGQKIPLKKKKTFFIQEYLTDQLTANSSFNYKKTVF